MSAENNKVLDYLTSIKAPSEIIESSKYVQSLLEKCSLDSPNQQIAKIDWKKVSVDWKDQIRLRHNGKVKGEVCGHEWTYTGEERPNSSHQNYVTCPRCYNKANLRKSIIIPQPSGFELIINGLK